MCRWRSALNYLAGLVYGDGSLYYYAKNNEYFTYVYDNDIGFLKRVGDEISRALGVRYTITKPSRNKNYYKLQFTSKKVYEYVQKLLKVRPKKLTKNFVRGFIDAEGTLVVDRKGRISLEVANKNPEIISKIARWLQRQGIHCTVTIHKNKQDRIYKIRIRGWDNVTKTLDLLKPLHPKLIYKFQKYISIYYKTQPLRPPP